MLYQLLVILISVCQSHDQAFLKVVRFENSQAAFYCTELSVNAVTSKTYMDKDVTVLEEIEEDTNDDEIHTIEVEQYMAQKDKYKENILQILSSHVDIDTAKLIYIICNDDRILIPNTFDKDELLKYWFVVNKGGEWNTVREFHRVDLYPSSHIRLTRRGMLSSVKGYKVSSESKYKLKFECKYILKSSTDWMKFSFKSSGVRRKGIYSDHWGNGEMIGSELWIGFEHENKNVGFAVKHESFVRMESGESAGDIPKNTELGVIMIDDGNKVNVEFYIQEKLMCELSSDSVKDSPYHRIGFFNRERMENIVDITHLKLSVIE